MTEDLYTEKLNWFKQNERPEVVLLLADNPDLVKIIVAWTSLDTKCTDKLAELPGDSESEAWEWLWENTIYSLKELKDKSGTSLSEIALENKMKPLIGNRIIYPDGTVNSFVERYLREQVVKLFEAKPKRPGKKN
jgi:hypothetical protein